ncbi:MAG: GH36 C-terminal domain-containing protein, partial [Anaerovoracaceae bacterium]|nr:GH36 C-terminal domain-containing protein [Anaerovoracaceae bacterium]
EALLTVVITRLTVNGPQEYIKAKGLDPDGMYHVDLLDITLSGAALMNAGIPVPREVSDYSSFQYYFKRV